MWKTVCPLGVKGSQIALLSRLQIKSVCVTTLDVSSQVLFLLAYLSLAASFALSLCFSSYLSRCPPVRFVGTWGLQNFSRLL